jgi:hypothetical protein
MAAQITEGRVFRAVLRGGRVQERTIKKLARRIGLDPREPISKTHVSLRWIVAFADGGLEPGVNQTAQLKMIHKIATEAIAEIEHPGESFV